MGCVCNIRAATTAATFIVSEIQKNVETIFGCKHWEGYFLSVFIDDKIICDDMSSQSYQMKTLCINCVASERATISIWHRIY